jgi:hypothetical protein
MRTHPTPHSPSDPISQWAADLRTEVIGALAPESVGAIVGAMAVGAVSTTLAVVATASAAEGGVTMTTTIAAAAASHVALKASALGLCAALAAGGTAAVTGNLPDGLQTLSADLGAHIGLNLPRPDAAVNLQLDVGLDDIVKVGGAGQVGVHLDGAGLLLTGIEAKVGFSTRVVSETREAIIVEFTSATETTSVLVTAIDGAIAASVTTSANAEGGAGTGTECGCDDTEAGAETEATVDAGLDIKIGG